MVLSHWKDQFVLNRQIQNVGASNLKQKVNSFRNQSSTHLAITWMKNMQIIVVVILDGPKLHDFGRTLDTLKRRLHEKGVKKPIANQQTSRKRYLGAKMLKMVGASSFFQRPWPDCVS